MTIPSFDPRIAQARTLGVPNTTAMYLLGGFVFLCLGVVIPAILLKSTFIALSVACLYLAKDDFDHRQNWLVQQALDSGIVMKKRPTFSASDDRTYAREHCWYTKVGDHGIAHKHNEVSIAFTWLGYNNRYSDNDDLNRELNKKVSILKRLGQFKGRVCTEHHFIREKSTDRVDEYLEYQNQINPDCPAIVRKIVSDHADNCRQKARTNRLLVVLNIRGPSPSVWRNLFTRNQGSAKNWKNLVSEGLSIFSTIKTEYPGSLLLSNDEFIEQIQIIRSPETTYDTDNIDDRFDLSEQLVSKKPIIEDNCLKLDDWYYKVCVIQNYPDMPINWFLMFCEASIYTHISQIILPKDTDKVLDKSTVDDQNEAISSSETRGVNRLITKIRNASEFRKYVSNRNLPTADNAYIVTFASRDKSQVNVYRDKLANGIMSNGGLLRDDNDLQLAMFQFRLPGQGSYTPFKRLDHAETIATMMPFTTFSKGSDEPEVLRLSTSNEPVTYSPSTLEVAHELTSGETGGGKDTQYGMKIIESYKTVRYDIVELGNSYQGLIEAIGGRYCSAKEQIINPLAPYSEVESAKRLEASGEPNLYANFLLIQSNILLPIFHGFSAKEYSRAEEVIVGRVLKSIYSHPIAGQEAPLLPDLLKAFDHVEVTSDQQKIAIEKLKAELFEFLETPTGQCFRQGDQYSISSVANAIDFFGLEGSMFHFFLSFVCTRLAQNAMSSGSRNQIILNEYKVLYESAPEVVRHITITIDRMGRKDWVGLTRISQGVREIEAVDSETIDSIHGKTLLSRKTKHYEIGQLLKVPLPAIAEWESFHSPDEKKPFREAFVYERGQWHKLFLQFPPLLLDLMNTDGKTKGIRNKVYRETNDPFKRIELFNQYINAEKLKKEKPNASKTSNGKRGNYSINDPLL